MLSEVTTLYQALYRKWRPKTFDDVIGQDQVIKTLKNEVSTGRISHAYLFTGSRGTGKTSCAKILAKSINCKNPKGGSPCGVCEICKGIDSENILDISEIDAASNNGVENIRNMREEVVFSPTKCKYRVYIVDEVHMLSTGAFNAFLKILEEPPAHVVFILATTEVHKIPATILSRCQRFDFNRISSEELIKRMLYICEQESIKIEEEAAKIIVNSADGAMRDTLSILDQCANSCKNKIDTDSVKNILGISGTEYIKKIAKNICTENYKFCLDLVSDIYSKSKSMIRLCEEITEYFRLLMIKKIAGKNIESEILVNLETEDILYCLDILQEAYKNMVLGTNKKIEMEITLVKLCNKFSNNFKPEKARSNKKSEVKVPDKSAKAPIPAIVHDTIIDSKSIDNSKSCFEMWGKILETLKQDIALKSLYISLLNSKAHENKNYILIDSKNDLAFELLRKSETRNALKKIIKEVTGKEYNLGPYKKITSKEEKTDPLQDLINNAKKGGININLEEN